MRWFVLQAADPETGCPAFETRFAIDEVSDLREIIGRESEGDAGLRHVYSLDDRRLGLIAKKFGTLFESGGREVSLEPWSRLRDLPYLVHAGFELPLMLEGRKPLAYFVDRTKWLEEYLEPFRRFVDDGRIVKRLIESETERDVTTVYFALPSEQWRIDAHVALRKRGAASGWNAAMEREEGSLLGYSDWENDRWAEWRAVIASSAHSGDRRSR